MVPFRQSKMHGSGLASAWVLQAANPPHEPEVAQEGCRIERQCANAEFVALKIQ